MALLLALKKEKTRTKYFLHKKMLNLLLEREGESFEKRERKERERRNTYM